MYAEVGVGAVAGCSSAGAGEVGIAIFLDWKVDERGRLDILFLLFYCFRQRRGKEKIERKCPRLIYS